MAVAAGIMVPHPPLIVPDVGRGQEILIKDTIKAYQEAAGMAAELKPDTLCGDFAPCSDVCGLFHVSPGKEARGRLWPVLCIPQIGVEAGYDEAFVRELDRLCGDDDFPYGYREGRGKGAGPWDSCPAVILLTSITGIISWCGSADPDCPFADHYRAGRYIARAAENLGRSVFIVASGDLSHKLRGDGPYGYSVQGRNMMSGSWMSWESGIWGAAGFSGRLLRKGRRMRPPQLCRDGRSHG